MIFITFTLEEFIIFVCELIIHVIGFETVVPNLEGTDSTRQAGFT